MRASATQWAAEERVLCIASAPKAAEDLAADGVVPIAEGRANGVRPGGPRAPAQHLVLGAKEGLGVLRIRPGSEARPPVEVARGPFPHVSDHAVATDG